jgi:hypothetical protein
MPERAVHRVVRPEHELLAVGLRRELVHGREMAPKKFLLLAADQANEVIVASRTAYRTAAPV